MAHYKTAAFTHEDCEIILRACNRGALQTLAPMIQDDATDDLHMTEREERKAADYADYVFMRYGSSE